MDASRSDPITIARRFCGPPGCGNGGYTAGRLATAFLVDRDADAVEVTLRQPPPLDTAMEVRRTADTAALHRDGDPAAVVAEARAATLSTGPVDGVSLAEAREAESAYAGLHQHPFPTCFTCGPQREPGDALRLSPGRIGGGRTACTWKPDAWLASTDEPSYVRREFVWAALDCPGGWTTDIEGRPMVLGRITAEIDAPAEVGERHVIMGRLLREDGRKAFTTTTLYDSDGRVVARAEHVWFTVDPADFS